MLARTERLSVAVRTPPGLVARVAAYADFAVTGDCFARRVCQRFFPYIDQAKAVFDVESSPDPRVCGLARSYGFSVQSCPAPPT